VPTLAPYPLLTGDLSVLLSGIDSPASFTAAAQAAFKKAFVTLVPALSATKQVAALTAAAVGDRRRLKHETQQGQRRLASGVRVTVTVQVDLRDMLGKAYAVESRASDDTWASSNATLVTARELFYDMAAALANATAATAADSSSEGRRLAGSAASAWDLAAADALAALPRVVTGPTDLDLSAATGGVEVYPKTIRVTVCSWDNPCEFPSPAPTVPHPSQTPTSVPTRTPDYIAGVSAASAGLLLLGVVQIVVGAAIVYKRVQHAKAKAKTRDDAAHTAEKVN
jgi:hypothetical protein